MHKIEDQVTDDVINATAVTIGQPGNIARPVGSLYAIFIFMVGGVFYAMEALVIRRFRVAFTNAVLEARNNLSGLKSKLGRHKIWTGSVLLVSMLGFGFQVKAVEIQYESKLRFYPGIGVLSMKRDDQILSCQIETIEYLECGNGTVVDNDGNCSVPEANTAFKLNYKVNDVDNCIGTGGTQSWQGALAPYAGGSGAFVKNIPEGISEDTTFGMTCNATEHHFGNIAVAHEIDLMPFLQLALNSASHNQLYPVIDMIKSTVEYKSLNSYKRPTRYDEVGFIVRRIEDKIHVIPSSVGSDVNIKVEYTGREFTEEFSTWISIVPQSSGDLKTNVQSPLAKGLCDSFAENPSVDQNAINLAMRNAPGSCNLSGLKEAWLTWYVLKKS